MKCLLNKNLHFSNKVSKPDEQRMLMVFYNSTSKKELADFLAKFPSSVLVAVLFFKCYKFLHQLIKIFIRF